MAASSGTVEGFRYGGKQVLGVAARSGGSGKGLEVAARSRGSSMEIELVARAHAR